MLSALQVLFETVEVNIFVVESNGYTEIIS